jgi:hypothetical protein
VTVDKRLKIGGQTVTLRAPSGTAVHGHGAVGHSPDGAGALEIVIDGHVATLHPVSKGRWHTHDLPFQLFASPEDAAAALAALHDLDKSNQETTSIPVPRRRSEVEYTLRGDFLEFCDCYTICPCWIDGAPDEGVCTGVFAWVIGDGDIGGIDVGGRSVVSVSTHEGHRDEARQRVAIFVDEACSDEQAAALAATFSGRFGGPLGDLATLLGTLLAAERAPIEVHYGECSSQLRVGRRINVDAVNSIGPNGRPTLLVEGRLANVLGSPAQVGVARRLNIALEEQGIAMDVRSRSAMRGRFSYRNDLSRK